MAAAVPDQDLPFDDGTSCGVGEVAGLFFDVEECRREGGLFYRMVCREDVVFDINPERVSVKNKDTELSVHEKKVLVKTPTSSIDVDEDIITLKVSDTTIVVTPTGVEVRTPKVDVISPTVLLTGNLSVQGAIDSYSLNTGSISASSVSAGSVSAGGVNLGTHTHSVTVNEEGSGYTSGPR